jgi:hypothetical protein
MLLARTLICVRSRQRLLYCRPDQLIEIVMSTIAVVC